MIAKAAIEFDALCEIEDIYERIRIACDKFSKGEISAKTIRMLWNILDDSKKKLLLGGIYPDDDKQKAIENMRRCPPEVLLESTPKRRGRESNELFTSLYENMAFWTYETSRGENKVQKLIKLSESMGSWFDRALPSVFICKPYVLSKFLDRKCKIGSHDTSSLGLPENLTFGIELEFVGIEKKEMEKVCYAIYPILAKSDNQIWRKSLDSWKMKNDLSVKRVKKERFRKRAKKGERKEFSGMECTSPILEDNEDSWRLLECMC